MLREEVMREVRRMTDDASDATPRYVCASKSGSYSSRLPGLLACARGFEDILYCSVGFEASWRVSEPSDQRIILALDWSSLPSGLVLQHREVEADENGGATYVSGLKSSDSMERKLGIAQLKTYKTVSTSLAVDMVGTDR